MTTPSPAAGQGYDVNTIAKVLNVTPRRIQQLAKEGLPTLGRGRYPLVPCVHWYVKYWQDRAESRVASGSGADLERARAKKTIAEASLAELELEAAHGRMIPLDTHERRVEVIAARLASRIKGLGRYIADVQRATAAVEAAAVLDRIADDLLAHCSSVADEITEDDGPASGGAAA